MFLRDKLLEHAAVLGPSAAPLHKAAQLLVSVYDIMKANGNIVPPIAQQDCLNTKQQLGMGIPAAASWLM